MTNSEVRHLPSKRDRSNGWAHRTRRFSGEELRQASTGCPTSVGVLLLEADNAVRGVTIGSFAVLSLEPPLVSVSLSRTGSTMPFIDSDSVFGFSILAYNQADIARWYSSSTRKSEPRGMDASLMRRGHVTGVPLIRGAAVTYECQVHRLVEAGDHILVICDVLDAARELAEPLVHVHSRLVGLPSP